MERLLTVRQVAEILRVSEATVYRMEDKGELHRVKMPARVVRFTHEEVERFVEGRGESIFIQG